MATQQDEVGSRLWRGMRALIFGDDGETSLRDQIEEAIDEAETAHPVSGDLTPHERQMLRNLLQFGDRTAGDICVTRGEIIAVPATIRFEELIRAFADAGHSRLPIYGDSLDEVIGMYHIKDVFIASVDETRDRSLAALMRTPLFVPESMGVIDLLARMRADHIHLAIVVDEFGGTAGLLTLEDVLSELVGDVGDEFKPADPVAERLPDGQIRLPGGMGVDDAAAALGTVWNTDATTVGGFVSELLGHLPQPKEVARIGEYELVVERIAERAVDSVLARRVVRTDGDAGEAA